MFMRGIVPRAISLHRNVSLDPAAGHSSTHHLVTYPFFA
jgi:hypothetical protein